MIFRTAFCSAPGGQNARSRTGLMPSTSRKRTGGLDDIEDFPPSAMASWRRQALRRVSCRRYFRMPSAEVGGDVRRNLACCWRECVVVDPIARSRDPLRRKWVACPPTVTTSR
jgi:hypothetical protein